MSDTPPSENTEETVAEVAIAPLEKSAVMVKTDDTLDNERKEERTKRWGTAFYGKGFERYTLIAEMEPHLPAFRDFYVVTMQSDPNARVFDIIRKFNLKISPAIFYPRPQQYQRWRAKWDTEMLKSRGIMVDARKIKQVIKTKSEDGLHAPEESELEMGVRHLGGELVNDALDILHRDQEAEELYEPDELMKRRSYVMNVFASVTRMVHGKEALKLKKAQDARETAGFLMDIMRQSTAGKLDADTLTLMRNSITPQPANVTGN